MEVKVSTAVRRCLHFTAAASLALTANAPLAEAQQELKAQQSNLEQQALITVNSYILGPGDGLQIELLDLPELSGIFSIEPDGTIYLPRLRALYVEGLTVEELRDLLTEKFSTYVREPQVYVRPIIYRPIRIYVDGEVQRPGYYTLSQNGIASNQYNIQKSFKQNSIRENTFNLNDLGPNTNPLSQALIQERQLDNSFAKLRASEATNSSRGFSPYMFPTVFDAIRSAQGVTPYTNLAKIQVTRKKAIALGGGRVRTNLNFLSLITEGDETQNIRLFDGDVIKVGRSEVVLKEQLFKATRTNLSPHYIEVFVTGRVKSPGGITIPQGSSLNQAISISGGTKFLKGKVEFIRFNREGTIDRRIFAYNPGASPDTPKNPILASGDLIRVRDSLLSGSFEVFNEVTSPFIGIYSVYSLFNSLSK